MSEIKKYEEKNVVVWDEFGVAASGILKIDGKSVDVYSSHYVGNGAVSTYPSSLNIRHIKKIELENDEWNNPEVH